MGPNYFSVKIGFHSTEHIIIFKLLTNFTGHTTGRVVFLYRYLVRMALKGELIPVLGLFDSIFQFLVGVEQPPASGTFGAHIAPSFMPPK